MQGLAETVVFAPTCFDALALDPIPSVGTRKVEKGRLERTVASDMN